MRLKSLLESKLKGVNYVMDNRIATAMKMIAACTESRNCICPRCEWICYRAGEVCKEAVEIGGKCDMPKGKFVEECEHFKPTTKTYSAKMRKRLGMMENEI